MENMHADDRCKGVKSIKKKKKKAHGAWIVPSVRKTTSTLLEIVVLIVTSDNQKIFDISGFLGLFN